MNTFDSVVSKFLLEQDEPTYAFDTKKVFYVQSGMVGEFRDALKAMINGDVIPLATGQMPAKKPLFQLGSFAGKMADSQLFASLIQEYYNSHGEPLKPKELLRNAQVKANEISLGNLYHDIDKHFGKYLEYRLPLTKAEMQADEPEEEEPGEEEPSRGRKIMGMVGRGLLNVLR